MHFIQRWSLSTLYFWVFHRYWSVFIILSCSYLTLPEKQSSSAATWASPGCHVFLKGCLRGTPGFRWSHYSFCVPHLFASFFSFFFSLSQAWLPLHIPHSEMQLTHSFDCIFVSELVRSIVYFYFAISACGIVIVLNVTGVSANFSFRYKWGLLLTMTLTTHIKLKWLNSILLECQMFFLFFTSQVHSIQSVSSIFFLMCLY